MELIIFNIGLKHAIISPALFAVLIIMNAVTTQMVWPIFDRSMGSGASERIGEPIDEPEVESPAAAKTCRCPTTCPSPRRERVLKYLPKL